MINSKQLQANIEVQKIALAKAQSDYNRRVPLGLSLIHICPAVLYRHRFAVGDLAGEKSASGENYSSTA